MFSSRRCSLVVPGIGTVKEPPVTEIGLSTTWFSVEDVRYGVTLGGGLAKLARLTVSVMLLVEVLVSTSATLPLVGLTAVAWIFELLEAVVRTMEPGRMNRLK